ncbi:MAG: MaoC family dehydratase N-terminal domain-containing protein [Deltaproteobacteria bacterium]|nr:MaoC family dehydratase N-terminal domain-containing protein [Deltaproteobacteria bacterium]
MEKPSWGKWGTWEETQSFLGKEIVKFEGADAVEKGSIRRWLEPKEFDCPIHVDEAAARQAGYGGVVAPSTMVVTYGIPAYWKSGDPPAKPGDPPKGIPIPVIFTVPAPCTLSFATEMTIEFFEPMAIGDQITCSSKLLNIHHKELRVGKGAFLLQEDTYKNQREEIVAIAHLTIFRFVPPEKGD